MANIKWIRKMFYGILIVFVYNGATITCNRADFLDVASSPEKRMIVVVSTLDGVMTALDGKTGNIQWSIQTGSGPLLSSSISNIQMIKNGLPSRLVPSLDGGLYQMDGEGIEPIPLAADLLLTSTYKLTDESSIVGGKEIQSYGLDIDSGKLKYACSSSKCRTTTGIERDNPLGGIDEVIVITRTDRTIRLVDVIDGHEKWNYSVGHLELSYHTRSNGHGNIEEKIYANEHYQTKEADSESYRNRFFGNDYDNDDDDDDVDLKVKMSAGIIMVTDPYSPSHVYWEHQFTTSIAGVWLMKGQSLSSVSLFDDRNIFNPPNVADSEQFGPKMLYIGMYNDMLYVQPSDLVSRERQVTLQDDDVTSNKKESGQLQVYMPRVKWRPYLATDRFGKIFIPEARSRTPVISNKKVFDRDNIGDHVFPSSSNVKDKSLILQSQNKYPFDGGYYLCLDYTPIDDFSFENRTVGKRFFKHHILSAVFQRWKEFTVVAFISILSVFSYMKKFLNKTTQTSTSASSGYNSASNSPDPVQYDKAVVMPYCKVEKINEIMPPSTSSSSSSSGSSGLQQQFVSRYLTDFQQQECLGKGGFGVVFKAYNRIDECSYAIKRIALRDSKTARDKVMREVKVLAKLEHPGIVRYYQSWFESPPPGWQEERDKLFFSSQWSSAVPTSVDGSISVVSPIASECKKLVSIDLLNKSKGRKNREVSVVVMPTEESESSGGIVFEASQSESLRQLTSGPHFQVDISTDEDVDEIYENDSNSEANNESHSIVFEHSTSACHETGSYDSQSLRRRRKIAVADESSSIVFEKSQRTTSDRSSHFSDSREEDTPENQNVPEKLIDPCEKKKVKNYTNSQKLFLYIQMQLCKPESLKEWLTDTPFDSEVSLNIFHQIVSAICYVHNLGLMHRDLKPSNIFFAMDGTVKIGDFGLVTAVEKIFCSDEDDRVFTSSAGGDWLANSKYVEKKHTDQVGTQLYMSPEQGLGQNYTHKVDIYALGVIFFEMFQRFSTQMERMQALQDLRKLKFPESFMKEFRKEYDFLLPLLSHDPSERPNACDLLEHELFSDFEDSALAIRRHYSNARVRTSSSNSSSANSNPIASPLL